MREREDQNNPSPPIDRFSLMILFLPPFLLPLHPFFVDIYPNPSFRPIFNRSPFHRSYRWESISGLQL